MVLKMKINNIYEEYINFTPLSPKTKELYINVYNNFWKKEIGNLQLKDLNYTIFQNGINKLVTKYNYNTVKIYKNAMFKFIEIAEAINTDFKFAGKKSIYIGKPIKKNGFNPNTLQEFYDLIEHTSNSASKYKKQFITALWIGFFTGMRVGEVFNLTVKDINFKKGEIYINKAKTPNGIRTVYMCKELKTILKIYTNNIEKGYLFKNKNGEKLKTTKISSYIRNFAKPRGYTIHFHTLRELFVKTMLDNGASIESVRVLLGHANTSVTLNIYLKTNTEEIKKDLFNVYNNINFRKKYIIKNKKA